MRFLFLAGVLIAGVSLAGLACGGSSEPTRAAPTAAPAATATRAPATATPVAAVAATNTPVPTATAPATATPVASVASTAVPHAGGGSLVSAGKEVFEKTAGGLGCAYCHGIDAKGKAELASPDIRGADERKIWNALETRVQMSFIKMTSEEVSAVAAYLAQIGSESTP